MHRNGSKPEVVTEEVPQPAPNPALGLYLVGWGIPGLLVGLSGAVNPAGYANIGFCSLGPGPGFTPVIVPVGAVAVFIFTRALMVCIFTRGYSLLANPGGPQAHSQFSIIFCRIKPMYVINVQMNLFIE